MSKNSAAKSFKTTKKDYKTKLVKDIKVFLKKNTKKSDNMVTNDTKIYKEAGLMKNKSLLNIEKNIIK